MSRVARAATGLAESWVATTAVPVGSQPMKLRATATPIETPTPAVLPAATATEAAMTLASMAPVMSVTKLTLPALCSWLSVANALALDRMMLVDSAPAPATAMPAVEPRPTASEAAAEMAWMSASTVLFRAMPPGPAARSSTLTIEASTSLSIRLCASATPIEIATALDPPAAMATAAAPAKALMSDVSLALSATPDAWMPAALSLPTDALTSVAILFSVKTPEPASAKPFEPPTPTATDAAATMASMFWLAVAVADSTPPALTLELSMVARICEGLPPTRLPCRS